MKKSIIIAVAMVAAVAAQAGLTWRVDINGATGNGIPGATEVTSNFVGWAPAASATGTGAVRSLTAANVDGGPTSSNLIVRLSGQNTGASNWSTFARTQAGSFTNLFRDGLQFSGTNTGGGLTISLQNLTAGQAYDVKLWSYDYQYGGSAVESFYDLNNSTNLLGTITMPANNSAPGLPTGLYDSRYVLSATLTANASGQINIFQDATVGQNEKLNGIEVTQAIPEPATALLFGLGGIGAWMIRRNKLKSKEQAEG